MLIEHTEIYGFQAAIRGMRNPFDSWDKSDSLFHTPKGSPTGSLWPMTVVESPVLGDNDLHLATVLIRQGGDHRKFLRFITVVCDLTLPRFLWQEVDTYKVGTVRNSCSTMNRLGKRALTEQDFETYVPPICLNTLNCAIVGYAECKTAADRDAVRVALKGVLPEGYLQRATYHMNYEVGLRMFLSRCHHRLPQWNVENPESLCSWILTWPYMKDFIAAAQPSE